MKSNTKGMLTLSALTTLLLFALLVVILLYSQHAISSGIKDTSARFMCGAIYTIRGAVPGGPFGILGFIWRSGVNVVPDSPGCGKIITVNPNPLKPYIPNITSADVVSQKIAAEVDECWGKAERDPREPIQCVYSMTFRLDGKGGIDERSITKVLGDKNNIQYEKSWQKGEPPGNTECKSPCAPSEGTDCKALTPGGDNIDWPAAACIKEKYVEGTKTAPAQNEYVLRIYYDGSGGDYDKKGKVVIKEIK